MARQSRHSSSTPRHVTIGTTMEVLELWSIQRPGQSLVRRHAGDPAWRQFVESRPEATIFHQAAWTSLLADTYGYEPVLLVLLDESGRIRAGAVFMAVRSRITGHRLVALPFTDHAPVLARDEQARLEFVESLVTWRREGRQPPIEIHAEIPSVSGVLSAPRGVRHLLALDRSPEALYRSFRGTQVDRAIRKAERSGVTVRLDRSAEGMDQYYRLHCLTRRRQGVPVQPRRFFRQLWTRVISAGHGFVAVADHGGVPVAGAVFLGANRCLVYKYGASDPASWDLRPNNLLFWKAIEWACSEGYHVLDFGKTDLDNHGLKEFKRRWGATEVPLSYTAICERAPEPRDGVTSGLLARIIRATPPVTGRMVGELLYRHFA